MASTRFPAQASCPAVFTVVLEIRGKRTVLRSAGPNVSGVTTFQEGDHVLLPVIRVHLISNEKGCWQPLQVPNPITAEHSVSLRHKRGQAEASENGHHCIALHPESFHLDGDTQTVRPADRVTYQLQWLALMLSCSHLVSTRLWSFPFPAQAWVISFPSFPMSLLPNWACAHTVSSEPQASSALQQYRWRRYRNLGFPLEINTSSFPYVLLDVFLWDEGD